jgi:hypothetical protein
VVEEKKKGAAHTLCFKFQEHTLEMDLVDPKTQPKTQPVKVAKTQPAGSAAPQRRTSNNSSTIYYVGM